MLLDAFREAGVLILLDPYLTFYGLIQRYLGLGLLHIRNLLDGIKKNLHQMVVVKAIYLDEQIVLSRHEMTFDNL